MGIKVGAYAIARRITPERIAGAARSRLARAELLVSGLSQLRDIHAPGVSVVVSLTTFGSRLAQVHWTIRSLLRQDFPPAQIELYLGSDLDEAPLPRSLVTLQDWGLEIIRGVEDLGPHKKYFFAMQRHPNAIVITADDDVIYPQNFVSGLLAAHASFPDSVVARRAHRIRVRDAQLRPYSEWEWDVQSTALGPESDLLATGNAGILYPQRFNALATQDLDVIRTIAWHADDMYLKCQEVLAGLGIVNTSRRKAESVPTPGTQYASLMAANVGSGRNDDILRALMNHYQLTAHDLIGVGAENSQPPAS